MIQADTDLNHSHPGDVEPYIILDVKDVRMDGAVDDQVIQQRATHIAAAKEYTIYKSQLLEIQEEKK